MPLGCFMYTLVNNHSHKYKHIMMTRKAKIKVYLPCTKCCAKYLGIHFVLIRNNVAKGKVLATGRPYLNPVSINDHLYDLG
jgi:hypothetical protein